MSSNETFQPVRDRGTRWAALRCFIVLGLVWLSLGDSHAAKPKGFEQGKAQFANGDFRAAIASFRLAEQSVVESGDAETLAVVLYNLAMSHHAAGQYRLAFEVLGRADGAASESGNESLRNQILALRGTVATFSRKADDAEDALANSFEVARVGGDAKLIAGVAQDYAILLAGLGRIGEAAEKFALAEKLAQRENLPELAAKVALNRALMHLNAAPAYLEDEGGVSELWDPRQDDVYQDHLRSAMADLELAGKRGRQLPEGFSKPVLLLGVGDGFRSLGRAARTFPTGHGEKTFLAYRAALESARASDHSGVKSLALGRMGSLYEEAGRFEEALDLTRKARAEADRARSPDSLYQWEWQIGRILAAQGKKDEALSAYRRARHVLGLIRHDVAIGFGNRTLGRSFREAVGALYFEMADLILQSAEKAGPDDTQAIYAEARSVIEGFKSAELEDFFQDECVNLALAASKGIEEIEANTAVFYVIPLESRTEILVNIGSKIHRFTSQIDGDEFGRVAHRLRVALEDYGDDIGFLEPGQRIFDAVIRPAEPLLAAQKIDTLVFVPDGSLRSVPMGAVHDGERFLIERFAVAITPGLQLMEPNRVEREGVTMLVGAVSEAVQGMTPLPGVKREVAAIKGVIKPDPMVLMDGEFLKQAFGSEIRERPYQIVQIASHGEFGRSAKESFLLAYDGKIDLNELEALIRPRKFVGQPVELLALSACRTAAGDDRTALGLAGVAVKSGARSAIATLWYVDDATSGALVSEFYRQLIGDAEISKAEALRRAQVKVMKGVDEHPSRWAPHLIIGNWL